jgi:hypothetical protein
MHTKRSEKNVKRYYKWKNRYKEKGIEGLSDLSKRLHDIQYKKITPEVEETVLKLRVSEIWLQ